MKLRLTKPHTKKHWLLLGSGLSLFLLIIIIVVARQSGHSNNTSQQPQSTSEQITTATTKQPETLTTQTQTTPAPSSSPTPQTQTTATAPKATPTPRPTYVPPPTTLTVSSLIIGDDTDPDPGICRLPVSTTINGNFTGSVTVKFATPFGTFDKIVTAQPGVTVSVQDGLTFVQPYEYTVQAGMSAVVSSLPSSYPYPTISYTGSTSGVGTCNN
jgi:hypothetical protein